MSDDFSSTSTQFSSQLPKKDNKKWIIIIVAAVLLVCCCCAMTVTLWYTGDAILEFLGSF
jgi:flagellar basal body-associated protein FliL